VRIDTTLVRAPGDDAPAGTNPQSRVACDTIIRQGTNVAATQLDPLLDRLGSDDAFREKMLGDPISALAEYGFRVDEKDIPAVRRLPAKKDLIAQREKIKGNVADHVCLIFFAQTR
jgi:putative modified peptide